MRLTRSQLQILWSACLLVFLHWTQLWTSFGNLQLQVNISSPQKAAFDRPSCNFQARYEFLFQFVSSHTNFPVYGRNRCSYILITWDRNTIAVKANGSSWICSFTVKCNNPRWTSLGIDSVCFIWLKKVICSSCTVHVFMVLFCFTGLRVLSYGSTLNVHIKKKLNVT